MIKDKDLNEKDLRDLDDICDECKEKDESVSQNLIKIYNRQMKLIIFFQ